MAKIGVSSLKCYLLRGLVDGEESGRGLRGHGADER